MGVLLAAIAAVVYGLGDWTGGHASRRMASLAVAVVGQSASLVLVTIAALVLADPLGGLGWGLAGGCAGVLGIVCFYAALAGGSMSVVAPTTAVVSLTVPVIVGVAQGERPSARAWVGIALAAAAVLLVGGIVGAAHQRIGRRQLTLSLLGGLGFGLIFVLLSHAPHRSGLWPLVGARLGSVGITAPVLAWQVRRGVTAVARRAVPIAVVAGILDMLANVCYLAATRHGMLSIVAVVSAMYPVSTVVLATTVDGERVSRPQLGGMLLAAAALGLVSSG